MKLTRKNRADLVGSLTDIDFILKFNRAETKPVNEVSTEEFDSVQKFIVSHLADNIKELYEEDDDK